jgi:hypothetical protein
MLPAEAKALAKVNLLPAANAANTAQATGEWVAVPAAEGDYVMVQNVGNLTGTLAGAIETAEDGSGTNNVALLFDDGANFSSVSADNNIQVKSVDARKNKGYMKYTGTVGTGPCPFSVSILYRPKTTT